LGSENLSFSSFPFVGFSCPAVWQTRAHSNAFQRTLANRLELFVQGCHTASVKKIFLDEAPSRLTEIFDDAQSGSPVLLVRGGEVAKLERLEPREFGGSIETLEKMLLEAVRGRHADWTAADLEDIAKRVRKHRRE
jgi:hypothetical protein